MCDANTAAGRNRDLTLAVIATAKLDRATREAIVALCNSAFAHRLDHDFTNLFGLVTDSMHILGFENNSLVAHACWAERRLQAEGLPPLRTAYVDAVAAEPALQRCGIGSMVMERFAREAAAYQLQALSSEEAAGVYERLGWERWRGPTAARTQQRPRATPNDVILVRRTPITPALDLTSLLMADDRGGQPW